MITIDFMLAEAELALASYAVLTNDSLILQRRALETEGFAEPQSLAFATRYNVVTQFTDPASGFSATVFADDGGNLTLAFRGTERLNLNDAAADSQLTLYGAAYDQIVAMYNWWMLVSTPANDLVNQYRIVGHTATEQNLPTTGYLYTSATGVMYFLEGAESVRATGELTNALSIDPDHQLNVTGHSLGGHLALAFNSLFANVASDVTIFNAPGVSDTTTNESFFGVLGGSVPTDANSTNVTRVIADESAAGATAETVGASTLNWSAQSTVTTLYIPIEDQTLSDEPNPLSAGVFNFGNHSQAELTDSLTVLNLLQQLAPSLSATEYKTILNQAVQGSSAGYERIVDALQTFFGIDDGLLKTGNNNRNDLYAAIYSLQGDGIAVPPNADYLALKGQVQIAAIGTSAQVLRNLAVNGDLDAVAYRYALHEFNPFVLLGAQSLYQARDQAGELELYSSQSPLGMSQQYINERSAMLAFAMTANNNNTNAFASDQVTDQVRYIDLVTKTGDKTTDFVVFLPGGTPNFNGPNTRRIAFGGDHGDSLFGRNNNDGLYGGAGDDYLLGGLGEDYLEGGSGFDLYQYNASEGLLGTLTNDGTDQVRDADGQGLVRYTYTEAGVFSDTVQTTAIAGLGLKSGESEWVSPDGKFTYTQEVDGLRVAINADAGGSIHILDFDYNKAGGAGFLGLRLVDQIPTPEPAVRLFVGDKQDYDYDPIQDGTQTQTDAFGNIVRADGQEGRQDLAQTNREDTFQGGSGAEVEQFQTGGGNDVVYADGAGSATSTTGGTDWVQLGAGRDFAYGGAGNDLLEGAADGVWTYTDAGGQVVTEAAGDVLQGGAGDDAIFGDVALELGAVIRSGETDTATGVKGDFLSGGAGADSLLGAAGDDLLFGGGGADVISAGAGDDTVESDRGYETTSLLWQVTHTTTGSTERNSYVADYSDNLTISDTTDGAADVIYGGAGNDWLFAGIGDDFVDGGTGNDLLLGAEGSDALTGGTGDDDLWGDVGYQGDAQLWSDYLDGGDGDDVLYGDWGDDILIGGRGNDRLYGGSGSGQFAGLGKDTYIFARGDGKDLIFDTSTGAEASLLAFGDGYDPAGMKVRPGSMILDFGSGDSVELASFNPYDASSAAAFENLSFADGTILTFQDVLDRGFDIDGTPEDDDGHDAEHPILIGTAFRDNISGFAGHDELQGRLGNDLLDGGSGDDRLFGMEGDDSILGSEGSDALVGGDGKDTLQGGEGADGLWGEAGDDFLDGGVGSDTLIGGQGDDRYAFGAGDYTFDFDGATTIVFRAGITASDVTLHRQVINTLATYSVELNGATSDADRMFIQLSSDAQLAAFEFSDGTVLDHASLLRETWSAGQLVQGTGTDDVLTGYAGSDALHGGEGNDALSGLRGDDAVFGEAGDDTLDGGAGNDSLLGGAGNDSLTAGAGNDFLEGDEGSDSYVIRQGGGADTILEADLAGEDTVRFADASSGEATLARRANGDLVVTLSDGANVTIAGQYNGAQTGIERIEFSDSTVITRVNLDALTVAPISGTTSEDVLVGTDFADTLLGQAGADTLDGSGGNDVLNGGTGVDTYVLGVRPGYGAVVEDGADTSAIRLASGVEFDDIRAKREGNNLALNVRGVDGGLILSDYYAGATNWTVSSDTESSITVGALLDYIEGITPPDTVDELEAAYIDDAELQYAVYLQSFGANGGVVINTQAPSDAPVLFRNAPFSETGSNGTFFLNIADITGGPSAQTLDFRSSRVIISDAGAGNDLINNQGAGFSNSSPFVSIGSFLYGNDGNDSILGTWAADTLLGGAGDDFLAGSDGNDTFVVLSSDTGTDVIDEVIPSVDFGGGHTAFAGGRNSTDTLKFIDVNFADATFAAGQFDSNTVNVNGTGSTYETLDISWGTGHVVRVLIPDESNTTLNQFPGHSYGVETIAFADGTTISLNEIFSFINTETTGTPGDQVTINGTEAGEQLTGDLNVRSTLNGLGGNDTLETGRQNDALYGGEGDDSLFAGEGDDVLAGGPGEDSLNGYRGNDVYLFNRGDGHDIIGDLEGRMALEENKDILRFGTGISAADIGVTQDGLNLHLVLLGTQDSVTLSAAISESASRWGVDRVEFADGTGWSREELFSRAGVIPASGFDDRIGGTAGEDIITGGGGDDSLFGFAGNDILRGGDGADDLEEWDAGINFTYGGNNLIEAGAGDDYVYHEGHSFVAAQAGNDWVDAFGDNTVIAFNAGDGSDTVYVAGSLTLSLGSGLTISDLVLSEDGTDLVLTAGADSVRLSRQFEADPRAWPAIRLQIVGSDIRTYDLNAVFSDFYTSQAGDPDFQMALATSLSQHLVSTSSNEAWGGDLAYAYARGDLDSALSDADVQAVLADADFGAQAQFVERAPGTPIAGGENGGVVLGTDAGEEISGGDGADWLNGGGGSDTLTGGAGNDLLTGGLGADTYAYNLGDGIDTIADPGAGTQINTVQFGTGITEDMLSLGLGSLLLGIGSTGGALHLTSFDPQAPLGARDIDLYRFADGTVLTHEALLARGFDLEGTEGADTITGTAVSDRITGRQGGDVLSGGLGSDTYMYNVGDGADVIVEISDGTSTDILRFGAGVASSTLDVVRDGDDIVISMPAAGDEVRLAGWFLTTAGTLERVEFSDGTFWTAAQLEARTQNHPPTVANPIPDQTTDEDAAFSYTIPVGTFIDPDAGDVLAYTASRTDGTPLPSWLNFDPETLVFSGTPVNDDIGTLSVSVSATDLSSATASDVFQIVVANTNDAPSLASVLEDRDVTETVAFSFALPANAFVDVDAGDVLAFSSTLSDGSALPTWLIFDPQTRTYSGTAPDGSDGSLGIRVTAMDQASATASGDFTLNIANYVILGTAGNDSLVGTSSGDEMDGLAGNDTVRGAAGNDILRGGTGNNTLEGEDGDDLLDGTGGTSNILRGGSGNDTYLFSRQTGYSSIEDFPSQPLTSSADRILVSADILPSEVSLSRIRSVMGNVMRLSLGASTVADVASQFDSSTPGNASVEYIEFLADGTVWDFAAMRTILDTPTEGADIIRGYDDLDDTILGLGGDDMLYGQYGNDTLEGGLGNDHLTGDIGDDTYVFRRGGGQDVISEFDWNLPGGNDMLSFFDILANEVTLQKDLTFGDLIISVNGSSDSVRIGNYFVDQYSVVENVRFADGTVWTQDTIRNSLAVNGTSAANTLQGTQYMDRLNGLGGNDTLYGDGGDDYLDGGAGADSMYGGAGDDTYIVDSSSDFTYEDFASQGVDTVLASVTWSLMGNTDNLTLTGSSNISGTGTSGANTLIGNSGRNTLNGLAGDDWLDGGTNRDVLIGGTGSDTYVVDNTSDAITENVSEGSDTVRSSITWTLGANLENLTLTGTANINGTGNTDANWLIGNSANNVLSGGAGADTLEGNQGVDTLIGGTGNDTYRLARGSGADLVQENDTTAGNSDLARFMSNIAVDQIWLQHTGNDLVASIIGTSDKLTIQNWYVGSQYHVEQFRTSDGKTLLDSNVQNLVNAMAAFAPPAPGQETLPADYATALTPVIAANWQ